MNPQVILKTPKGNPYAALLGTFVVQLARTPEDDDHAAMVAFEHAMGELTAKRGAGPMLFRQLDAVRSRREGETLEFQVKVEVGPDFEINGNQLAVELDRIATMMPSVAATAVFSTSLRELTIAEATMVLDVMNAHADDMSLALFTRKRWSDAAGRLRPYLNGAAPIVRATTKPLSKTQRFAKSLMRMARYHGGGDIGLTAGIRRGEVLMPFVREHIATVRGETCTDRHLQDLAAASRDTLNSYQTGEGLSSDRQVLRRLAIQVLDRGEVLTEADVAALLAAEGPGASFDATMQSGSDQS